MTRQRDDDSVNYDLFHSLERRVYCSGNVESKNKLRVYGKRLKVLYPVVNRTEKDSVANGTLKVYKNRDPSISNNAFELKASTNTYSNRLHPYLIFFRIFVIMCLCLYNSDRQR